MSDSNLQHCPVCKVKILKMIGGDRVLFAAGAPGTRESLWQKVCQHTENFACINKKGKDFQSSDGAGDRKG